MKIRLMRKSDALQVAQVHTLGWQKGFAGIVPQHYLDSLDIKKRASQWENGLSVNPDVIRLVAENEKEVVGLACGLENRFQDLFPEVSSELWALYIHPGKWGKKIGAMLFEAFTKKMKESGHTSMLVWVLEDNLRARHFYEKKGGRLQDRKKIISLGGKDLTEVCYVYDL